MDLWLISLISLSLCLSLFFLYFLLIKISFLLSWKNFLVYLLNPKGILPIYPSNLFFFISSNLYPSLAWIIQMLSASWVDFTGSIYRVDAYIFIVLSFFRMNNNSYMHIVFDANLSKFRHKSVLNFKFFEAFSLLILIRNWRVSRTIIWILFF